MNNYQETLEILSGDQGESATSLFPFTGILVYAGILFVGLAIFSIFWIINMIRQWKVQDAILETRDIVKEMNERDKARTAPSPKPTVATSENPSAADNYLK